MGWLGLYQRWGVIAQQVVELVADDVTAEVLAAIGPVEDEVGLATGHEQPAQAVLVRAGRPVVTRLAVQVCWYPQEVYQRCGDQQRRLLPQAALHSIYIGVGQRGGLLALEGVKVPERSVKVMVGDLANATTKQEVPLNSQKATRSASGPSTSVVALLLEGDNSGRGSNSNPMVEVLASYSNHADQHEQLDRACRLIALEQVPRRRRRPTPQPRGPRRFAARYDAETQNAMVAMFLAGATADQVAKHYGCGRTSINRLLKRRNARRS